jgi:tight adherence protein B
MNPQMIIWTMLACLGLAGLGLSALVVMRGQAVEDRVRLRVQTATTRHMRVGRVELRTVRRVQARRRMNSPTEAIAQLFGVDVARPEQYATRWWVIVLIVLVGARIVTGILVALIGAIGWFAWPLLWVFGARFVFAWMVTSRRDALFRQFPDSLAMMVRSIRAGVPMNEAIRIVARESPEPTRGEFSLVAGDLSIGVSIGDALKAMAERNGLTEYRFFATALTLQSQTGGRLGETLENLASVVRRRMAMKMRGKALASEAQTSAMILGGLPVISTGGLYFLNPKYMDVLFSDPTGRMILTGAIVSLLTGVFVMRTIIQKSLS